MDNPRKKNCPTECPRYNEELDHPCIGGVGPETSKIMLIGESPGKTENKQGMPFVGLSGELLDKILGELGVDRSHFYITNAVKCFTHNKDPKPSKKNIKLCKKYLIEEIKRVKPKILGCLGNVPLDAVLGRSGIKKLKNNVFISEEFGLKVIPTYHPAYVLRNMWEYNELYRGIKLMLEEAKSNEILLHKKVQSKYLIADTEEKALKVLNQLEKKKVFSFDLETSSLNFLTAKILCIGVSWKENFGVAIPWDLLTGSLMDKLKALMISDKLKVNQNIKFDIKMLMGQGIKINGPYFDTISAHNVLDENSNHDLETLVLRYLPDMGEYWAPVEKEKKAYCKKHKMKVDDFSYDLLKKETLYPYGARDADAAFRLTKLFIRELKRQGLWKYYSKHVLPYMQAIIEMEVRGVRIDRKKLKMLVDKYSKELEEKTLALHQDKDVKGFEVVRKKEKIKELRLDYDEKFKKYMKKWETGTDQLRSRYPNGPEDYAEKRLKGTFEEYVEMKIKKEDYEMNFNSTQQLGKLLFEYLGLPIIKKTEKGNVCTDAAVMEELAEQGITIAEKIVKIRELQKYLSTYIVSVYNKSEYDERIHANYLQHQTVTGRLASKSPNMQNIPRDAKDFKDCFIVNKGNIFVKADLAQAEFRCWSHYANDRDMINDIKSGLDIHRRTASRVFKVTEKEITKDQRTAAKACVSYDSWIPTNKGFKQIKDIKVGDVVLDHYNEEQKVLETIIKKDYLYSVNTESGSLKCTKDHPFYVIDTSGNLTTKTLLDLKKDDYILSCTPKNKKEEYITWKYDGKRNTSFKSIKNEWVLDEVLGYFLGFFMAEGSISKGTSYEISWSQAGKFVNRVDQLGKQIFSKRVCKYIDKRNDVIVWKISSIELFKFLEYVGISPGKSKGMKSFPFKIIESPKSVQRAFLQGYFLGDGTFKGKKASLGTVSKNVCDNLCFLLRCFGIYPKVYIEHPKGGKDFYNIHITTKEELKILVEQLGFVGHNFCNYPKQNNGKKFFHNINMLYSKHTNADVRYNVKIRKHITHNFIKMYALGFNKMFDKFIENGIYSVRINSIEKLKECDVYDFVTTGDKTMVANGFYTLDCVFGPMFGRGSKAIAKQYGISEEKADEARKACFDDYPDAANWIQREVIREVKNKGYVESWFGRRRRLPGIYSDQNAIKAEAERQAKNSPIQSLSSDMNNAYMRKTLQVARKNGLEVYPITTIHDANFFEVKEEQKDKLIYIMKKVVERMFPDFRCKMELDFEVGYTLGTLEEI